MVGKGKDLWHVHLKSIYEQSAAHVSYQSHVSWYMNTVGNQPDPTNLTAAKATPLLMPRRYFFLLVGMSLQFFAGGHGTYLEYRDGGCD